MSELPEIFVGTSGWSYPRGEGSWNGYFYPAGKIDELVYYSRFFNTVEINSSFYRPPDPAVSRRWAQKVPDGFLFTVKLWQKFTHPKMFETATGETAAISQADVDIFQKGISPLIESGKMGALLAQFPPSFRNNESNRHVLHAVINTFDRCRLAVELRHHSWSDDDRTAALLRDNNVAWVQIDEPKFPSSVAARLPVTGELAYFRYHGRNAETWWSGNNETRYKYLYSPEEIIELSHKIVEVSREVRKVFAFFNNHWKAYAPRNAVDMVQSLGLPFAEIPQFGTGNLLEE